MDPSSVFIMQAATLRNEMAREAKRLDATFSSDGPYAPFAGKLSQDIAGTLAELDGLIAGATGNGALPQRRWSSIRETASGLLNEALTLRLAGFIRENHLDGGMCAVADLFLAELARQVRLEVRHLSTVAESEYFGSASRVIRMRYPASSVWDLPALAHEFSHWFGPLWHAEKSAQPYPFQAFLENTELGNRSVAEEYFCDLMAVFLLGPAYPYMCITLRFNPTSADDGDTHPADAKRAWWVLRGLELLAETAGGDIGGEYCATATQLRQFWSDYGARSGAIALTDTQALNSAAEQLFPAMQVYLPAAAYVDPGPAWGLVRKFKLGQTPALGTGDMRHLLNACWFLRNDDISNLESADRIDTWARALARKRVDE